MTFNLFLYKCSCFESNLLNALGTCCLKSVSKSCTLSTYRFPWQFDNSCQVHLMSQHNDRNRHTEAILGCICGYDT